MSSSAEPDPIVAAERVDDLIARVSSAPGGKANAAITDADIRMLCDLPVRVRADALERLGAVHGVAKRPLHASIKMEEQGRKTRMRSPALENWTCELRANREGEIAPVFSNACRVLEERYHGRLAYDRMSSRPCLDGQPVTEHDLSRMRRDFGDRYAPFSKEDLADAVCYVGRETNEFHPVENWLLSLKWDETKRLDTAATILLGLKDRLSRIMLKRTMIGSVARAFAQSAAMAPDATDDEREGAKMDTVLVLLGFTGRAKTEFLRILFSPWFLNSRIDIGDTKRGAATAGSAWGIEWGEVEKMVTKYTDAETKGYLSQRDDSFIPMYARAVIRVLRSHVVVGTTNKARFLTDVTGDRRWWILNLLVHGRTWRIDLYKVAELKLQLWAEAVDEYFKFKTAQRAGVRDDENPHRWWMNEAEETERARRASAHHVEDGWIEPVAEWLAGRPIVCPSCKGAKQTNGFECRACVGSGEIIRQELPRTADGREFVTLYRVLSLALAVPLERHPSCYGRAADTLVRLGWTPAEEGARGPEEIDGKPAMTTRYLRPLDADEIAEAETRAALADTTPEEAEAQARELEAQAAELRRAHGLGAAREETALEPAEETEFFGEEVDE